jgi:diguanylate cyclase (GGDEF)-like protein
VNFIRPTPLSAQSQSAERDHRNDRTLWRLTAGSILVFVSCAVLVTGVALGSAAWIDAVAKNRHKRVVAFALGKSVEKISYDQESVAIWDDSVVNVRNSFNPAWVDVNLGVWMYDYFKHDRVYILDAKDRTLYTMADGKQAPANGSLPSGPVASLIWKLRQNISAGALDDYESGKIRIPRAVDLGIHEQRPAIISVMPLVPDTDSVTQERGSESLIVSVRYLDKSFLHDLAESNLLKNVRFASSPVAKDGEQTYPVADLSGHTIGYLNWSPNLPGRAMLSQVLPVMAAGIVAIGIAVALLLLNLRKSYRALSHTAYHDELTGLPNRAAFNRHLEHALLGVQRGQGQIALMFLDLDRFKHVNDTLGHAAGDQLIREFASRLARTVKPSDMIARMGGDEFAIISHIVAGKRDIEALCQEIMAEVSKPFEVLGVQNYIGVSIGIAVAPSAGTDRSELARKADIALYEAKNTGRSRFQLFSEELGERLSKRQRLESDLRLALETGAGLDVFYQPVYSASDLTISGVEALARWQHPTLGPIAPLTFVPLAEECGLIGALGDWVLRTACRAASAWDIGTVAVNVSPIQFNQPDFAKRVLAVLAETHLPPSRLEIEITESTLLDRSHMAEAGLKILREAGVKVALDDFGTGYSSLSYLLNLDVDRIKIDKSFVYRLGESQSSLSIIQAIVTMARAVGVAVTAEGVETNEQRELLTLIGCDHLQGYILSRPLTARALGEHLADRRTEPPAIEVA